MNWRERARGAVGKNSGGTALTKPTKPGFVSSVSSTPRPFRKEEAWDYTLDDLKEMRRLIRELGQLEQWTDEEVSDAIDQSNRMAPVNVPVVLRQLREWTKAALAPWPEKPAARAPLKLCRLVVIQGGKSTPADQAKSLDAGKEAA